MDYSQEFAQDPDLCYLNHAAVAPWPKRASQAVEKFARENQYWGATHYPQWMTVEAQLRLDASKLLNAGTSENIALVKNTSEALSFVAYGLQWHEGDEVIISDEEFPSNRIVWQSLKDKGVKVVEVCLTGDPEDNLINAFTSKTRLLSISSVQYASGLRINLEKLGHACKQHKVLFCVDAIQSIGACQLDVKKIQADFVMADGHKWMLGPEGLGLFYTTQESRDLLRLTQFGWHMTSNPGDYTSKTWDINPTAQKFECGSPNMLAIHALQASLSLLLEVGMQEVEKRVLENTDYLQKLIENSDNLQLIRTLPENQRLGICVFEKKGMDSNLLYQELMKQKVICASRGGGVRFSPHFYTSKDIMRKAVSIADNL